LRGPAGLAGDRDDLVPDDGDDLGVEVLFALGAVGLDELADL
jgi:hypothetical protein